MRSIVYVRSHVHSLPFRGLPLTFINRYKSPLLNGRPVFWYVSKVPIEIFVSNVFYRFLRNSRASFEQYKPQLSFHRGCDSEANFAGIRARVSLVFVEAVVQTAARFEIGTVRIRAAAVGDSGRARTTKMAHGRAGAQPWDRLSSLMLQGCLRVRETRRSDEILIGIFVPTNRTSCGHPNVSGRKSSRVL